MSNRTRRKIERAQPGPGNGRDLAALKSEAYDVISLIERAQARLNWLNQAIAEAQQRPAPPTTEPDPQ